jgi:GDP-mannose 6-dehydrogenase
VETDKTIPVTHVAVLGLGYVGCVTAACLARMGHRVIGVDPDTTKVNALAAGEAPFFEPGLDELVKAQTANGNLRATSSLAEALDDADVALICVGTPSARNGNLSTDQLERVSTDIGALITAGRTKPFVVAVRSTVFPGTCEEVVMPRLSASGKITVVSNPEFLREGSAVKDFLEPSLIVVGGIDQTAVKTVAGLYDGLPFEPCLVSLRTAELIKYACNAYHAVKVAFANEIGSLASTLAIDGREVMATVCQDKVLNISAAYLKPGFAFGGSCLPKDLRALNYRGRSMDLKLPLLDSAIPSNVEHLNRAIQSVLDAKAGKLGVFGLAFKENTDDLRESPVVALLEHLIGKGRNLKVYDPHIRMDKIYGSNQRFVMNAIPHIGKLMEAELGNMLGWAETIVLAQKPSVEHLTQIKGSKLPVIDLVGVI